MVDVDLDELYANADENGSKQQQGDETMQTTRTAVASVADGASDPQKELLEKLRCGSRTSWLTCFGDLDGSSHCCPDLGCCTAHNPSDLISLALNSVIPKVLHSCCCWAARAGCVCPRCCCSLCCHCCPSSPPLPCLPYPHVPQGPAAGAS